jgi:hypothetical protein
MLKWFGPDWHAPVCKSAEHVATPEDAVCYWCEEPIRLGDNGVLIRRIALHMECHVRSVVGSVNHQEGNCACHGKSEPEDPPGMSTREAAKAAMALWERGH